MAHNMRSHDLCSLGNTNIASFLGMLKDGEGHGVLFLCSNILFIDVLQKWKFCANVAKVHIVIYGC